MLCAVGSVTLTLSLGGTSRTKWSPMMGTFCGVGWIWVSLLFLLWFVGLGGWLMLYLFPVGFFCW